MILVYFVFFPFKALAKIESDLSVLEGRFGFNWRQDPSKARCVKVDNALRKKLVIDYKCNLKETTDSSSGKPRVVCRAKNGSPEYLIFRTKESCEDERKTQEANEP
jgi:hypothetical protein